MGRKGPRKRKDPFLPGAWDVYTGGKGQRGTEYSFRMQRPCHSRAGIEKESPSLLQNIGCIGRSIPAKTCTLLAVSSPRDAVLLLERHDESGKLQRIVTRVNQARRIPLEHLKRNAEFMSQLLEDFLAMEAFRTIPAKRTVHLASPTHQIAVRTQSKSPAALGANLPLAEERKSRHLIPHSVVSSGLP